MIEVSYKFTFHIQNCFIILWHKAVWDLCSTFLFFVKKRTFFPSPPLFFQEWRKTCTYRLLKTGSINILILPFANPDKSINAKKDHFDRSCFLLLPKQFSYLYSSSWVLCTARVCERNWSEIQRFFWSPLPHTLCQHQEKMLVQAAESLF